MVFSPDGRRIVTGHQEGDQDATVWDATSGAALLAIKGHAARVFSAAFSPEGRRIVTGSQDQTAKVWDAASGEELLTLKGHKEWILSDAFSPDGQHIVTGSADRTAKVWEAASAEQVARWQQEEPVPADDLAVKQRERTGLATPP